MSLPLPPVCGSAGAAFQLRKPAPESLLMEHAEGDVFTREGAPYITVVLRNPVRESDLRDTTWRVVQEALDVRAATHRQALSTFRGDHEYLLWIQSPAGYSLVIVDVADFRWSMNATATVTADPNSPPPPPPVPYHPALRFYRLSQLSDDLYDSFRNAYLALECLVSDASVRGREYEPDWLIRVLSGPLAHAIPGGLDIHKTVENVYKFGRLPLFHAKTGKLFYLPHSDARADVQSTLGTLHILLASIMHFRVSSRIPGGWGRMSQGAVDSMARVGFRVDELIYCLGSQQEATRAPLEIVESPRRFGNIWARVVTRPPVSLAAIDSISLRVDGTDSLAVSSAEAFPLQGVSSVRLELNQLESNVSAPNPLHPA